MEQEYKKCLSDISLQLEDESLETHLCQTYLKDKFPKFPKADSVACFVLWAQWLPDHRTNFDFTFYGKWPSFHSVSVPCKENRTVFLLFR